MIFLTKKNGGKTVYITEEQQRQILSEAADDTFDYNEMERMTDMYDVFEYCWNHMGQPVGEGSSRSVFQFDDYRVIKVAKNKAGIAQNNVEAQLCHNEYDCFPKIFNKSENDIWIDCEYVLPAQENDFKKVLGMSWDDVTWTLRVIFSQYGKGYAKFPQEKYDKMMELVENNPFWCNVYDYMTTEHIPLGDLLRLDNWGMTRRNGKTMMVILDSGFNYDIYNAYYK